MFSCSDVGPPLRKAQPLVKGEAANRQCARSWRMQGPVPQDVASAYRWRPPTRHCTCPVEFLEGSADEREDFLRVSPFDRSEPEQTTYLQWCLKQLC